MAILSLLKRALVRKTDVVTFSLLDYWTMLELFDRFPLYDLVRLNGLVSWWSGYVDKVCLTKRSITVNCGYNADRSITGGDSKDKLKVVTIDSTISDRLGRHLPNITSLEVIIGGSQTFSLSDMTYLISQWSHQLVDLKLEFDSTFVSVDGANSENGQFNGLLLSLNRITTLRRLTIHSESDHCRLKDPIDLHILAQLQYFYLHTREDNLANFLNSIVHYVRQNVAFKQINLAIQGSDRVHNYLIVAHNGQQLLEPFSKCSMLRNLNTRYEWAIFANQNYLHIGLKLKSRSYFMDTISETQPSLRTNTLLLTFCIDTGFDRNRGQVLANIPPIQSVTKLELNIMARELQTNSYSAFKSLEVNLEMFPNVREVHLELCHLYESSGPLKAFFPMIWRKISMSISYRKLKRRVRQDFPNVKCSFKQRVYDLRNRTLVRHVRTSEFVY